jgi:hypothetical protein
MQLLGGSLAQSTWKKYGAALNKWRSFARSRGKFWKEISEKERGNFIGWCKGRGKLTANTVKIYLGALEGLAELKTQLVNGGGRVLERGLLRGYANLTTHDRPTGKATTTPVDISILHAIKGGIGSLCVDSLFGGLLGSVKTRGNFPERRKPFRQTL